MAETLLIKYDDLTSTEGKPSKLQRLLFKKFEKCQSINKMSIDSGLHHHTIKQLLMSNGSSQKLTRSNVIMLSTYLNISKDEIEQLRQSF